MTVHLHIAESPDGGEYIENIRVFLNDYFEKLENKSRLVFIGVSGGSMPKTLCPVLRRLQPEFSDRVRFFPVDERLVSKEDPQCNMAEYLRELPQFEKNMIFVNENLIKDANNAAEEFENDLKVLKPALTPDNFPIFDVLFLGIGPDGHTCSLFPDHPLLNETSRWVAPIEDSPKPPPRRVTVTIPVLLSARKIAFITAGASKAEVIKEIIFNNDLKYPPARLNYKNNDVHWFVDRAAISGSSK